MLNDQVDLAWVTGAESDNRGNYHTLYYPYTGESDLYHTLYMIGFIVEKRPSYGGDFEEIASFQEVSQLISKGAGGGRYVLVYYTILYDYSIHSYFCILYTCILEHNLMLYLISTLSTHTPNYRYRYTDPSTASGSWVYRVKDSDSSGVQNVIAQCFVEVQTASESKSQQVRHYFYIYLI